MININFLFHLFINKSTYNLSDTHLIQQTMLPFFENSKKEHLANIKPPSTRHLINDEMPSTKYDVRAAK